MSKKPEATYPIAPLAAALLRHLDSELQDLKSGYKDYFADDRAKSLFIKLLSDDAYEAIVDRPHDDASFLHELKAHADALHREYGVVLTIRGKRVQVEKAGEQL